MVRSASLLHVPMINPLNAWSIKNASECGNGVKHVRSFFRTLRSSLLFFRDKGSKYYSGSVSQVLLEIRARTLLLYNSRADSLQMSRACATSYLLTSWLLASNQPH